MGVIIEYAKLRIDDMKREAEAFLKAPLRYIQDKQPIRRALLVEYLDNIRPVLGAKLTPKIPELHVTPIVELPRR